MIFPNKQFLNAMLVADAVERHVQFQKSKGLVSDPKVAAIQSIDSYLEKQGLPRNSDKHLNKLLDRLLYLRQRGKLKDWGTCDFSNFERAF